MKTKSEKSGTNTLDIEVTNISIHGFWLLISRKEYFLPFEKFPWFRNATIANIHDVMLTHSTHLYWPSLDIDLNLDSIENPDQYPLIAS
jgi:hypothetical protein